MKLSQIPELSELLLNKCENITFTGVQCDSRRVRPGDLFVAIQGSRDDGAKYIEAALARGASGIVSQRPVRESVKSVVMVKDARLAMAYLSAAAHGWPARQMRVLGITGTNGKTTVAWLTREILLASGADTGLISTVQVEYGGRSIPATRTTPDTCELQQILASMRSSGCDSAVMEVSSHALDQLRVAGVRFSAAAFTNLSRDHLDYHDSMESYFTAKTRLFTQLARETPGSTAVCCVVENSAYCERMLDFAATLPLKVVTCGFGDKAMFRADAIKLTPRGGSFTMVLPDGQNLRIRTKMAGRHNIMNMLCASALAMGTGVELNTVVATLEKAAPRWGRMERVRAVCPATVFVDYAHTDDALRNVLTSLREITRGRVIVVFGCGGNRDQGKRPKMGAVCGELADQVVVTSDNPRQEDPLSIIEQIVGGIGPGVDYRVEPDRRAAIGAALRSAGEGDVVIVAGKGHEMFQEMAERTVPFDDRQVIMEEAALIQGEARAEPHDGELRT